MSDLPTILISVKSIPGGDRRLYFTECGEYLVLDRVAGKVNVVGSWQENEFMQAAEAFKGSHEKSVI